MSFTKHLNGVTDELLKAVAAVYEEKKDKEDDEIEFVMPEEIAKEDQSDFVVAASAAKKAGKKKFKFGGKEFPVTIKTAVQTESEEGPYDEDEKETVDNLPESCGSDHDKKKKVKEEDEVCDKCGKSPCECDGKKNEVEVNPELEEETQIDEALTKQDIAKAIEIAMDNEGAMTKAVKMIEKIKRGLSKHKDVEAALRLANEEKIAEEKVEEATDAKKVFDYLVKKGSNPKDARKMVNKHYDYASDKYSKASVAKMAEVIMSLDEEALSHDMKKAWQKVGTELKKYGATKGGIDKKEFQDIGHMFDFTTRVDDAKKGHTSTEILNRIMGMDTDVRDKMMDIVTGVFGTKWKNSRPTAKEIFGKYLSEGVELEEKFGPMAKQWQKGAKSVKVGDVELVKGKPGGVHTIKKNGKTIGDFSLDDNDLYVVNIDGKRGQIVLDDIDDILNHLNKKG